MEARSRSAGREEDEASGLGEGGLDDGGDEVEVEAEEETRFDMDGESATVDGAGGGQGGEDEYRDE